MANQTLEEMRAEIFGKLPTAAEVDAARVGKPIENARFWLNVDKTLSGCWLWTGKTSNGYGVVGVGGRAGRTMKAHRAAYESLVGAIPVGMDLDHLCRVRNCVNPAHLEPVTRRENLKRSPLTPAGKTHCPRGHDLGSAAPGRRRLCRECHRVWDRERAKNPARREALNRASRESKARQRLRKAGV